MYVKVWLWLLLFYLFIFNKQLQKCFLSNHSSMHSFYLLNYKSSRLANATTIIQSVFIGVFGLKEHCILYSSQLILDFINAVAFGLCKEFHGLFLEKASAKNGCFVDEILKTSSALSWIITEKSLCNSWLQNWGFSNRKVLFRFYTLMLSLYKAQVGDMPLSAAFFLKGNIDACIKWEKSHKIPIFGALYVYFFSCYKDGYHAYVKKCKMVAITV